MLGREGLCDLLTCDVRSPAVTLACPTEFRSCVVAVSEVKSEEIEMIPKSGRSPADWRKRVGVQEFAALARCSLNGNGLLDMWPKPGSEGGAEVSLCLPRSQVSRRPSETT